MKKVFLAIALGVLSLSGFAETRDVKAETPAKSENKTDQDDLHTYYVTSQQIIGGQIFYNVTTSNPNCPNSGSKPCEVLSDEMADANGRIPQSAVQSVETTRP
ncbi:MULTISPECIES: hypothetical protein [Sphingobacterium]|uniref:hypothetical protein n=1 Tax=Sphingobacterium TaxID=28453 RepID=UPI0008A34EE5|nr:MULTISPECIES: hypothetical protein [Sphingobacterium]OFV19495.1 hypothetical protein HMPREF3127_04545 [Sphingobacterium sp. HMSC13C05]